MKKKPIAVSWMRFYVLTPVQSAWERVSDFFTEAWVAVTGGWWCEYCHKYHCRRVLKFKLTFTKEGVQLPDTGTLRNDFKYCDRLVCSLGRDAVSGNTWAPDNPTLGDLFNQMDDSVNKFLGSFGGVSCE
jgi:hypothetical protein